MRKYTEKLKRITGCFVACALLLTGCEQTVVQERYEKAPVDDLMTIADDQSLYEKPIEQPALYLTVGWGSDIDEEAYTWNDINCRDLTWYEDNNEPVHESEALVQFGNEEGPISSSYGFGNVSPNARVKLTGLKASGKPQKSYRIKLKSGSGNVSGIKSFVLSKSFGDPFRFTNKLCFDLISETDGLLSVRTDFVHLYVKDKSMGEDSLFIDYGLYTMEETINKKYLSNRGLDKTGELYRAENFDFGRHSEVIMPATDPGYNKEEFEKLLEAKGSNDYSKLICLLDALNDSANDIEYIVDTYFYKDNLYAWMAFNILVDNKDTDTQNFYLYSPTGTEKFYIIPWDMDGALRSDYELLRDPYYSAGWEKGIYLYTDSQLFSRIIKSKHCVNDLSKYIAELHESILSGENVSVRANRLSESVKEHLYLPPDMTYARVTADDYDMLLNMLPEQMDRNYYAYYDSLETPWPFHINEPKMKDGNVILNWDESCILEGSVSYEVELSDSWDFTEKIKDETNVTQTTLDVGHLEPGQYFVRITAVSDNGTGLKQEAYEYYNSETKTKVHGVFCFYIKDDGTVVQSTF